MIRCLSVCSGIEAWSCAVEGMDGYSVSALSEIEPFPCAVLAERYPFVPNLGDMTKINGWAMRGQIDLLVGGTPCQGFSVAGLRGGLNDPRSGLAGHYVRLAAELRVPWLLWENVPGALSTSGGADFRAFVSALDELGYGLAWAVLDAQWFGVAQRRKRLFLVGRLGDWRGPGQVLFEPRRVCGNPPARRRKGEGDAPRTEGGAGAWGQPEVSGTVTAVGSGAASVGNRSLDGFTVLDQPNDVSSTLCASGAGTDRPSAQCSQEGFCVVDGPLPRRLTPVECERLQGFPDGWTAIQFQGKPAKDSHRYRALGNSMAVPVMRWLAEGIREFF